MKDSDLLPPHPTRFDYLHAIRALLAKVDTTESPLLTQACDFADQGMNIDGLNTVELRFHVNNTVYFIHDNVIKKGSVTNIRIDQSWCTSKLKVDQIIKVCIKFGNNHYKDIAYDRVHLTKQALVNHLINTSS